MGDDEFLEVLGVDQIAVVREAYSVGRVHVKRLCVRQTSAPGCRVANMSYADVAPQFQHVAALKNVSHQPVVLADMKTPVLFRDDPGRILAAMLEDRECVIERQINGLLTYDTDDSAHCDFYLVGLID
jgi:hypothetical protein